jgi:multidrug efflux pump subunit AcrA (membrane-fusion protein)
VNAHRWPRLLCLGVVLMICGLPLGACKEVETEEATTGYEPAKLEPVAGNDVMRVTFTAEGAARTGLQVGEVRRTGQHKVAPYAALIYDAAGKTYVYTTSDRLSFLRRQVKVDRIDGDDVLLSAGPAVHTKVVTVGAAEVYGTELDVAGSH